MATRRRFLSLAAAAATLAPHGLAHTQSEAASAPGMQAEHKLFAVEFKTGPRWQPNKQPGEQEHFREHSTNLRRLREQGRLVLGARYGDKGLVILAAESESAARAMVEQDLSVKNGVFGYELHEFSVFYGGAVQTKPRGQ
jgi:uncharacterized protein YciI